MILLDLLRSGLHDGLPLGLRDAHVRRRRCGGSGGSSRGGLREAADGTGGRNGGLLGERSRNRHRGADIDRRNSLPGWALQPFARHIGAHDVAVRVYAFDTDGRAL